MRNDYFNTDEFKDILERYEASKKRETSCYFDAEDFVSIADYYLLKDRPENAIEAINLGLEEHPDDDDLLSTLSGSLIYMHRYEDAREIVNTLPQNDGNVMYQRAQLAYAIDNDIETAEELFYDWLTEEERMSKHDSEEDRGDRLRDAILHVLTSFIELQDGTYDEELIKRWVEEYYARFAPLGSFECDLVLADMVRNENISDMTEKIYSSLLEYDPYINYGWVVLSTAQIINGKYQEALESVEFALAIDPGNLDALLNKAHAYYSLGQKDMALPLFEKFLKEIDDVNQYLPYAICLISSNREEESIPYLEKAEELLLLHKDSKDYYAQLNFELSEAYLSINKLDKALDCINRSIEFYPEEVDFLLLGGTIQLLRLNFQECVEMYTKCIENAEDKVQITCVIALRFMWHNQNDIALNIIDTTATYDSAPSMRIVSAYKAYAYMQKGDMDLFLSNLEQACRECPDVISELFYDKIPATVKPQDYYNWILEHPFDK